MITAADYFAQPTLRGHGLRLEPLGLQHEAGLKAAAADGKLWNIRVTSVPEPENTRKYIEDAIRMHAERKRVPYAVIDETTGQVLGSTSFHDLIPEAKRLEIGYTWYAKSVQRSHVNTACKLIMMARGFDELGALLVGWRTDIFNFASQRAIERLGATREAVLRSHGPRRDGTVRDTVIYGMPVADWPAAKARLLKRLDQGGHSRQRADVSALQILPLSALHHMQAARLAKLSPGTLGERFVSHNGASIAQAATHPCAVLRAAMLPDAERNLEPVGLLMLYDPLLNAEAAVADEIKPNDLCIWRCMVGFHHQGRGVGQALIAYADAYARSKPGFTHIKLSHVPDNEQAARVYAQQGFAYTGDVDGGELVMARAL
jgi:N-acetyltransferase